MVAMSGQILAYDGPQFGRRAATWTDAVWISRQWPCAPLTVEQVCVKGSRISSTRPLHTSLELVKAKPAITKKEL
jgi:hypothetical protein